MRVPSRPFAFLIAIVLAALVTGSPAWAQTDRTPGGPATDPNRPSPSPADGSPPRPATQASSEDELALTQSRLADKYARLEDLLIRMSELEGANNPQRSALLLKAAQQSKEKLTRTQLNNIVKLLNQKQLKRAVTGQEEVQTDLKALLDLLLSENRSNRLKNEQARMREYIKEVERLIRQQKTVQGRTEGATDPKQLAEEQGKVADKTGELAKQMQLNEEGEEKSNSAGGDSKEESGDPVEPKDGDQENKPSDAPSKPTKSQAPSDKGEPEKTPSGDSPQRPNEPKTPDPQEGNKPQAGNQESQPDGSKPKPGEPKAESEKPESGEPSSQSKPSGEPPPKSSDSSKPPKGESSGDKSGQEPSPPMEPGKEEQPNQETPKSDGFPARKRLAAAEDRMREAERKLKEAKRNEAQDEEEKAREELEKAKAELEEILRQLREEEVERMLAMLEGRFRRILESQLKIYESTKRLDQVPVDQRDREFPIQASRLSFDESKLAAETLKTLNLLHEDGSSLAFPESVDQMHDDMQQVTERLATTKVDKLTQGIEEEIIAALEEMIDALQKAQQDAKEKKEQNQPPPGGQPNEPPLVDQLAELKMIRALQMRVNTRTQRYAKMLENTEDPVGQALEAELVDVLAKLAEREQRIHELTRDIVLGKNK